MKIFDHDAKYTDEEWMQFATEAFKIDENWSRKLEEFTNFVIGDGTPAHFIKPVDKVYGESMLSEYRSKSLLLPCGCPVESVSRWTEAMYHIMKPDRCPTLSKKEKT